MSWLNSICYGLISGIAQFLPISASAHQKLYLLIFGYEQVHPLQMFFIHIGCLIAVYTNARHLLNILFKKHMSNHRRRIQINAEQYDLRMVKTSALPLLVTFIVLQMFDPLPDNLIVLILLLIINGIALFIPDRMLLGNKDARFMSGLDSYLIGFSGALSALPGFSGIGMMYSLSVARGADRKHAYRWAIILSFYLLCAWLVFDLINTFSYTGDPVKFVGILCWLLSGLFAYIGSCISIRIMQFLSFRNGLSGFAYYSWGAALLVFILYLTVV